MDVSLCFEIYQGRLPEYYLVDYTKHDILTKATIIKAKDFSNKFATMNWEDKLNLLFLFRFYRSSSLLIKDLYHKYTKLKIECIDIDTFVNHFQVANKEFQITKEKVIEIISKLFKVHNNGHNNDNDNNDNDDNEVSVNLESFFNYFQENNLTFKIGISEMMDITLQHMQSLFSRLEIEIGNIYDMFDLKKQGLIFMNEFKLCMNYLLTNNDNIWKIVDYYK